MKQMTPEAAAETEALIAELWQRHLPTLRERLDILDRIAATAAVCTLSEADREEGVAISHKFAGSLGMYGYHRGSELASALEQLFRGLPPSQPDLITPLTTELRETLFPGCRIATSTHQIAIARSLCFGLLRFDNAAAIVLTAFACFNAHSARSTADQSHQNPRQIVPPIHILVIKPRIDHPITTFPSPHCTPPSSHRSCSVTTDFAGPGLVIVLVSFSKP